MPQVLQLAHLVQHHRVADMDVGRRRVQAQLDAQRLAGGFGAGQLGQPVGLRQQFLAAAQRDRQASRTRSVTGGPARRHASEVRYLNQLGASWRTQALEGFATRYRKRIVAAAVVAMAGFTVTAFGIAPLAPTPPACRCAC
jgi:hypothetical protein